MKAIIFDVDGTMIDTEEAVLTALQETLAEEAGMDKSMDELHQIFGIPGKQALEKFGVEDVEKVRKVWVKKQQEHYDQVHVFEGIEDTLEKLKTLGIATGVVTSKTDEGVLDGFTPFGLDHYFSAIVTASQTTKHKPHPEPLLACMEKMDLQPKDTIYVGDSIFDYQCAQEAGTAFGVALWGAKSREDFEGADYFFEKPQDILQLVKEEKGEK